jgi:threonine dehydrogenase-like Zn-dependent dehydrogenase
MLAFQVAHGKLKPTTKPLPKLRPCWALIRLHLAGICNTDVEILRGYHAFRGTPGHEFVGEVAEVSGASLPRNETNGSAAVSAVKSTSLARPTAINRFAIFAVAD